MFRGLSHGAPGVGPSVSGSDRPLRRGGDRDPVGRHAATEARSPTTGRGDLALGKARSGVCRRPGPEHDDLLEPRRGGEAAGRRPARRGRRPGPLGGPGQGSRPRQRRRDLRGGVRADGTRTCVVETVGRHLDRVAGGRGRGVRSAGPRGAQVPRRSGAHVGRAQAGSQQAGVLLSPRLRPTRHLRAVARDGPHPSSRPGAGPECPLQPGGGGRSRGDRRRQHAVRHGRARGHTPSWWRCW